MGEVVYQTRGSSHHPLGITTVLHPGATAKRPPGAGPCGPPGPAVPGALERLRAGALLRADGLAGPSPSPTQLDARRRCLDERRHAKGDRHPDVRVVELNLGIVAHRRGDAGQARTHLRRALAILEGSVSGSPQVGTTHHWLAQTEVDLGNCEAARSHLRHAADVLTQSAGPDDLRADRATSRRGRGRLPGPTTPHRVGDPQRRTDPSPGPSPATTGSPMGLSDPTIVLIDGSTLDRTTRLRDRIERGSHCGAH